MRTIFMRGIAAIFAVGLALGFAAPAWACGGLLAPNGAVRLDRATTLIDWHNGMEHYMTAFSYQGDVDNLGWFVPLPAIPDKIEAGGAWTLQRLNREVHPPPPLPQGVLAASSAGTDKAQVIETAKIDALNISVLKGSGQAVIQWAAENNFLVDPETAGHILTYAQGSPIFMAAKFDTSAARARHQLQGDGTPVLITMHTAHPWVPLEVLGIGGQIVHADLFFLTDQPININQTNVVIGQSPVGADIPGATGFKVSYQQVMSNSLYHDLSTDRNMSWVRANSWVTYMTLDAPSTVVTYDLGITPSGIVRLAPFGTAPMLVVDRTTAQEPPQWAPHLPIGTPQIALLIAIMLVITGGLLWIFRRQGRRSARIPGTIEAELPPFARG